MRKGLMCLLILGLLGWVLVTSGGTTQSVTISKTAIERMDDLNEILDEILDGLSDGTMGPDEFADKLEEAYAAFGAMLSEMPMSGPEFSSQFSRLYEIRYALDEAAALFYGFGAGPFPIFLEIQLAELAKLLLKWDGSGDLSRQQLQCSQGKALVTVYSGFDCNELKSKLRELLGAGKCVTVVSRETEGYQPPATTASDYGPVAARLYKCLGGAFQTGPTFEMRRDANSGESGFTESHTFGDPTAGVHVSQAPTEPHPALEDSALASDVQGGVPTRIDPMEPLQINDVVKPWYKIGTLCSRTEIGWMYYDPAGSLVYTDSSTLDPADRNTDCVSRYSSAGWTTLRAPAFGMGGTYTVELWFGDTYSALHRFTMAGAGPQPPIVNDDFYVMDEDSVLDVNGVLPDPPLLANDGDPDPEPLQAKLQEGPRHGDLDLNPDGTFTYTPMADFYGVDWFSYVAVDPGGLEDVGEVTILVKPVDDPPVANGDVFVFSHGWDGDLEEWTVMAPQGAWPQPAGMIDPGRITIPAPGLMLNDHVVDPNDHPLTVSSVDIPEAYRHVIRVAEDGSVEVSLPDWPEVAEGRAGLYYSGVRLLFDYEVTDQAGGTDRATAELRLAEPEGASDGA